MRRYLPLLALLILPSVVLLLYAPAPAAVGPEEADVWVVKVFYEDQAELQSLANWREPWEVNEAEGSIMVEIRPAEYDILTNLGFTVEVDQALTAEANIPREPLPGQGDDTIPGFPCYRTVESTLAAGADLASSYPALATWSDIGDSWEKVQGESSMELGSPAGLGYDIMVLKLTNSSMPGPKPVLFTLSAIHAREYATAELNTRFAEHLLANYGTDADVTWLLDYHEIHLVLQGNPDGRKIAEGPDIWHRKTTNDDACSAALNPGIDMNRNFPFLWGFDSGSSSAGCDDTYRGVSAISEPETAALVNYVRAIFPDQRDDDLNAMAPITTTGTFLDIHSHGRVILWPWGPPDEDIGSNVPPNQDGFNAHARRMGFLTNYSASKSLSYSVSGTTKDFAYGELGIPGYTLEIGTSFHQSCSYFENTLLPDNLDMLIYAAKAAAMPYAMALGPDPIDLGFVGPTIVGQDAVLTALVDDGRYGSGGGNNPSGQVASQNIAGAYYYLNIPPWEAGAVAIPMAATDGTFDSSSEMVTATIDTSLLTPGQHIIYVQAEDSDGDNGVVSAIFLNLVDGESNYLPLISTP